jgi:nicotinate-nucleotide adenylyltransferase
MIRFLLKVLDRLEEIIVATLIGAATIVIFVSVVHRYAAGWAIPGVQDWLLRQNMSWAQEACIYMFIWMAKFGAAYGVRTGIHVGVDVFINTLKPKIRAKFVVIGLLGGAFDPAHEGHVHITREALKRLGLDQVWWLVTPGNPLKARQPAPLADRMARASAMMRDPRVKITALEAQLGTRMTVATIERLKALYPGVTFVWLMGADNLVQFHRWGRWRDILRSVAVGVLARPGSGVAARNSVAARAFRVNQVARGENLRGRQAPVWAFVNLPMNDASSTDIRARGGWTSGRA